MGNKHWVKGPQMEYLSDWRGCTWVILYLCYTAHISGVAVEWGEWAAPQLDLKLYVPQNSQPPGPTDSATCSPAETRIKPRFAKLPKIMSFKENHLCKKKKKKLLHHRCLIRCEIMKHLFVLFHPDGISAADLIVLPQQKWQMTFISPFSCKR